MRRDVVKWFRSSSLCGSLAAFAALVLRAGLLVPCERSGVQDTGCGHERRAVLPSHDTWCSNFLPDAADGAPPAHLLVPIFEVGQVEWQRTPAVLQMLGVFVGERRGKDEEWHPPGTGIPVRYIVAVITALQHAHAPSLLHGVVREEACDDVTASDLLSEEAPRIVDGVLSN